MKPLQLCLSASIVLALLLSSAQTRADDTKDGKKKTVRAVFVAEGDGDSKTIQIEGASLEEVHRLLADKLKDLPAGIRKQIEAGLKQAKIQQSGNVERRAIVRRSETKESTKENARPRVRVQAHAVRIGPEGKTQRVEVDPRKIRVRIAKKDGSVTDATKNIEIELDIDDDNPKIQRRIRIQKLNDKSAHPAHGDEKKIERRIIIGKIGAEHAHGDHKHEHGDEKKVGGRIVIGGVDLQGLPKEMHAKIRAAIEKLGLGDSDKKGSPRVIVLKQEGEQGAFEFKDGIQLHVEGAAATIRKKLESHAAEVRKAAATAHKLTTAKIAEAKKVQSARAGQGSSINKRLDKIEGELRILRKLLEEIRDKD